MDYDADGEGFPGVNISWLCGQDERVWCASNHCKTHITRDIELGANKLDDVGVVMTHIDRQIRERGHSSFDPHPSSPA